MNSVLIGHRGEPDNWPENSLAGYRAVLAAGARLIETDVQISADGVAVLSHDPSLLKVSGHNLIVTESPSEQLLSIPAGYPDRFGDQYETLRISTLTEFAELLAQWPEALAFVEIKHASIQAFGADQVIDIILDALEAVQSQCILISFEYAALQHARECSRLPIGWVLPDWNDENRQRAEALAPEFLFVNRKRVPPLPATLWPGPWQWAVYTINEVDDIRPWLARGFQLVETNVIRQLLNGAGPRD